MTAARTILLLVLAGAAVARAAEAPLLGKKLRLRDSSAPAKRSVAFVLTGAIDLTGVDPTQDGATVTLASGTSGYSAMLTLAAAHWSKAKSKPTKAPTYQYTEHDQVSSRAVSVKLMGGKLIKLAARGPLLPALGGPLGGVMVTVDAGTLHLCGLFGGKIKKDDGSKFVAAKAPAPADCSGGSTTTTTIPPPPALGTQIDRDGRPGISTVIVGMYGGLANTSNQAKDQYNAAASPAGWSGEFVLSFRGALAVWDAIDASCGNQLAAGGVVDQTRYSTLAGVLVDDQLYVDTTTGICTSYLPVERNALGLTTGADCGGRVPGMDVVDTTYSILVAGALSGVTDGIANDSTFANTFPFLPPPN